jgi:hypothetical protein
MAELSYFDFCSSMLNCMFRDGLELAMSAMVGEARRGRNQLDSISSTRIR